MTVASQRRMVFDGEPIRIYIIEIERDLPSISVEVLRLGALRVSGIIVSGFGGDMNGKYCEQKRRCDRNQSAQMTKESA